MEMHAVSSSALKEAGYENGEIGVRFHNGSFFYYPGTKEELDAMLAAKSVGKHFLSQIKPRGGSPLPKPPPHTAEDEPRARA